MCAPSPIAIEPQGYKIELTPEEEAEAFPGHRTGDMGMPPGAAGAAAGAAYIPITRRP